MSRKEYCYNYATLLHQRAGVQVVGIAAEANLSHLELFTNFNNHLTPSTSLPTETPRQHRPCSPAGNDLLRSFGW